MRSRPRASWAMRWPRPTAWPWATRAGSSSPKRTGRPPSQLWPQLERLYARTDHPLSGHPLEAAKAGLTLAHELSTAYKHLLAQRGGEAPVAGRRPADDRAGAPLPAMHGPHPGQQLPRVRAGAAAHLARRAPRLRLRAEPQAAPERRVRGPAGGDRRAHVRPGAAARARESLRLPPGRARAGAALPAGARPLGEAHRHGARAPDGEGGGRSSRWATTSRRSRRTRAARWRGRSSTCSPSTSPSSCRSSCAATSPAAPLPEGVRDGSGRVAYIALHEAPAAPVGHPAGAPVQPPAVEGTGGDLRRACKACGNTVPASTPPSRMHRRACPRCRPAR